MTSRQLDWALAVGCGGLAASLFVAVLVSVLWMGVGDSLDDVDCARARNTYEAAAVCAASSVCSLTMEDVRSVQWAERTLKECPSEAHAPR